VRSIWCVVRLDHPVFQHHLQHGPADPQRAALLRPVRALLVHAGQVLVRLDDRDARAAADHAQAVLDQRAATLASLQAKDELQQSTIQQASADLDAKTAQAGFAKVDADRYRTLALSNYGSRQDAERTTALDGQARASVASAKAALAAAKQQLTVLNADISEATAAVAQARADLETA